MTRVKGFAPWEPKPATLDVVADIQEVLREYRAYLPMTVRQIFYRLVAKGYPKTHKFYKYKVVEYCGRARRAGMIPFSAIRDDGLSQRW